MNDHGTLIVISGFSGAGKGTLMKALLDKYDNYALSISATTRKPRTGEIDGKDYFFTTREQFVSMIEKDELIEHASYVDNYYGTPKKYVLQKIAEGKDVLLEIEIQGALKVKEKFPDTVLLFVMPPSAEELKRRLIGRGTESMDIIRARLKRASEEASGMDSYDYILLNDEIDKCVEKMHQVIQTQHNRTGFNIDFINQIKEELKNI